MNHKFLSLVLVVELFTDDLKCLTNQFHAMWIRYQDLNVQTKYLVLFLVKNLFQPLFDIFNCLFVTEIL